MSTASTQSVTSAVYRIVFYQIMMIVGFALILFLTKDIKSGFSAMIGGLAYWLPTTIFTRSVAACSSVRAMGRFMIAFFGGEVFKLALSGTLFLLAVKYMHVQILDAVVGLVVGIVAFWAASILCLYRSRVAL